MVVAADRQDIVAVAIVANLDVLGAIGDGVVVDSRVIGFGVGAQHDGLPGNTRALGNLLPDLLGDVRHHWVEHAQVAVEHPGQHLPGGRSRIGIYLGMQAHLGHLEVPVAVLGPDGGMQDARGLRELEAGVATR